MTKKGNKTKQTIIEESKKLFAKKGYAAVTMKDICEACSLSRGGLYRHFGSAKEIFIAMLEKDIDENRAALQQSLQKKVSADLLLDYYLNQEKAAVFCENKGIYFAIHEFAFIEQDQGDYFDQRLRASIDILNVLFTYGQEEGTFKAFDVEVMSSHVIYFWDSMKTSSTIFTISGKMVDKQIELIKEMII